ncbi:MAG: NAD+ kinase [Flavobacteriales bacterium]|jgi:NAD+ kinase
MIIAIYGKSFNDSFIPTIQHLFESLEKRDVEIIVYRPFYTYLKKQIGLKGKYDTFFKNKTRETPFDVLLSIGGDGTLLETITIVKDSGTPILGINTGRLGFLSHVGKDDIEVALDHLMAKEYTLDKRSLIQLETLNHAFGAENYALNELTISKKDTFSMVTIHTYINQDYLNSYWADGLIISTPTGSTAYNLSCGGPILVPSSENFILTPISAHNLTVRPIVVDDKSTITIRVEGRSSHFLAALDARSESLDCSTELTISKAPFQINLIKLPEHNFHHTLRNKLMWGMDKRN